MVCYTLLFMLLYMDYLSQEISIQDPWIIYQSVLCVSSPQKSSGASFEMPLG